ncbi:MAG: type II toxin-antitoxin system death-on-curing family toxin [bacterium]|nr:type II toxin-antitoxin system death-on-curing family toxin [bacterium]
MKYLRVEDILLIHSVVVDETGGSHGVRDNNALLALEALPKQSAFGKELYSTIFHKGAVYIRNIIFSHPFVDGNKRSAMAVADVYLQLNGYRISVIEGGVEKFALSIIEKHLDVNDIAKWLKNNSKN